MLSRIGNKTRLTMTAAGYGFGFHPIGGGGERYYGHGHGGGSPGMNGEMRIYPGLDQNYHRAQ